MHLQVHEVSSATTFQTINRIAKSTYKTSELTTINMDSSTAKMPSRTSLFQVYLRLRPPMQQNIAEQPTEPWLLVEQPPQQSSTQEGSIEKLYPTHITLQPPNDSRKRAIERFGFTKIFHEHASQMEVFDEIGAVENIQNVLKTGRDGLIATLGVTGSGKVCSGSASRWKDTNAVKRAIQFWEPNLREV